MKPLTLLMIGATALGVPAAAQYPSGYGQSRPAAPPAPNRTRQVDIRPPADFVVANTQRQGTTQIVEWVPRGQTARSYDKVITLNTFVAKPGLTPPAVLSAFAQRYRAACPRATVAPIVLGGGNTGVRIDCPRTPRTGKPETVFARAIAAYPAMAIVQYATTYFTMPAEATHAREFLARVAVR